MRIVRGLALEGPNIWMKRRALEVWLQQPSADPHALACCTKQLARTCDAAAGRLRPSESPPLDWPRTPQDAADLLVTLMLNLQRRVDLPVREGFVIRDDDAAVIGTEQFPGLRLVVEIVEESVGRRCLELACELFDQILQGETPDFTSRLTDFAEFAYDVCLGSTTGALVQAAQLRGIPVLRLDDVSLVQLGYGARQHRIQTAMTDRSGCIAEAVSRDKALTKTLLRRLGIPVPEGRLARDAAEAWNVACEIGVPVVVKPCDADYGNGVSLRLTSREEVTAAFEAARHYGERVIVERFLDGVHHRVTVVGGKVVAAIRREPIVVVGDGCRTVAELIDELNQDPRRGAEDDHSRPWMWIEVDDELRRALASQGAGLNDIPRPGKSVVLRFDPHICWGGGAIDVTDDVHPDVAAAIVDAVLMIGLDVAGVDVMATDISCPLTDQNGGLLEVNAGPAIFLHLRPFCQPPRPVPEAIISMVFPNPEASRIPLIAVGGDDEPGETAGRLMGLLRRAGWVTGRCGADGVFVEDRRLLSKRSDNLEGARTLQLHPRVESAVCEVSLNSVRNEGLAFDEAYVVIALSAHDPSSDANPGCCDDDRQQAAANRLAAVRALLDCPAPRGTAVINIDDRELAGLVPQLGARLIAITADAAHPELARILERKGRAVFFRDGDVILATGSHQFPLWPLSSSHWPVEGAPDRSISLLAAIAAGWALDIAPEVLRSQLSEYAPPQTSSVA